MKNLLSLILFLLMIVILLAMYLVYLLLNFNKDIKTDKESLHQNGQMEKYTNRQHVQHKDRKEPKYCPFCGSEFFYDWIYTYLICTECRGLVDYTPFGLKEVMPDASIRFPEILTWWKEE